MKKESMFINYKTAKSLGIKFYISENPCSKCGARPSLRYVCNMNCISCNRKRYKEKEQ